MNSMLRVKKNTMRVVKVKHSSEAVRCKTKLGLKEAKKVIRGEQSCRGG